MRELFDEVLAPDLAWIHADLARDEVEARSTRCVASGRPAPRYGSVGIRLVRMPMVRAVMRLPLVAPPASRHATAWKALKMPWYAPISRNCVNLRPAACRRASRRPRGRRADRVRGRGLQALGASLDPVHRASAELRRRGRRGSPPGRDYLAAEASADVVSDHAKLVSGHAERAADEQTDEVRDLGEPDGQLIVERYESATRRASPSARGQALLHDALFDDDVGLGEGVVDVSPERNAASQPMLSGRSLCDQRAARPSPSRDPSPRAGLVVDHDQLRRRRLAR